MCFSSCPPPCNIIPPCDAQNPSNVKKHYLDFGVYISIASLYGRLFFFQLWLNKAGDRPYNQKGQAEQNRQAPKIKNITFMRVLNPPKVENHPPHNSPWIQHLQVCTGTWAIFLIWSEISSMTYLSSSFCKQQLFKLTFPNSSLRSQQIV
jgi:hypothetical protein